MGGVFRDLPPFLLGSRPLLGAHWTAFTLVRPVFCPSGHLFTGQMIAGRHVRSTHGVPRNRIPKVSLGQSQVGLCVRVFVGYLGMPAHADVVGEFKPFAGVESLAGIQPLNEFNLSKGSHQRTEEMLRQPAVHG